MGEEREGGREMEGEGGRNGVASNQKGSNMLADIRFRRERREHQVNEKCGHDKTGSIRIHRECEQDSLNVCGHIVNCQQQ